MLGLWTSFYTICNWFCRFNILFPINHLLKGRIHECFPERLTNWYNEVLQIRYINITWKTFTSVCKGRWQSYPLLKIISLTRSLFVKGSLTISKHSCITSRAMLNLQLFSVSAPMSEIRMPFLIGLIGFSNVHVKLSEPTFIGFSKSSYRPEDICKNEIMPDLITKIHVY